VTIDPVNPEIIYADMWAGRQGPWENGAWNGKESGLFKSTDGGKTWRKLTKGLPSTDQGLGRIGFCIAPSNDQRMYATVDAGREGGIYRSDDAGESWIRIQTDNRFWGRAADFAELKVDPKNADIVYSANVVTWKSIDGGKTWNAFRGAPGGDDYHRIWINPDNTNIILIASDQGAIITVNGGETFSSWYNQPTAQFYHVSTDNAFPYNVYGGQQESGSAGVSSRGNDGAITFREWHPVGAEEYAYVAPDPLDPDIIYGGKISRYDKRTGQSQNISPEVVRSGKYRFLRTAPVLFNPIDKRTLYYAGNVLFKTMNGGQSWEIISPDLSREKWDIPASVGIYTKEDMRTMPRRGVIYTVAPSYKDIKTIWCGTDDGLIHVTKDGGRTWKNVTPPGITSWSKISLMDAGHFDANTVYAAVNRIRVDDMKPHIYRTHDGGKNWKEIVNGLPDDPINVVREDPLQQGLLYAGSERAVYFSIDDGENWQSLRLNMPATSIRDLVIKDDDLVVGTHGRSFWILDNITPLRFLAKNRQQKNTFLYPPATTWRVRWNMYTDTPLPQEEPAGDNPPDGAIIDYVLNEKAKDVRIYIQPQFTRAEGLNKAIRSYTSSDTLYNIGDQNIPLYWIRPQQVVSTEPGHHRFAWDLKYDPLNVPPSYPIAAVYKNTAPDATAPWVMPGIYKVTLYVDGKLYDNYITVKMDPRVKTSAKELQLQHDLSLQCYERRKDCMGMLKEMRALQSTQPEVKQLTDSVSRLNNSFAGTFSSLQDSDWPPTSQMVNSVTELNKQFARFQKEWSVLKEKIK
jgi:photosystem II stability/assembly factor-like uncharacterized protein